MIGISTLAAMAQAAYRLQGLTHVASAIDARMEEVYWGRYVRQEDGSWQAAEAECVIAPALLAQTLTQDDLTQDEQIWRPPERVGMLIPHWQVCRCNCKPAKCFTLMRKIWLIWLSSN